MNKATRRESAGWLGVTTYSLRGPQDTGQMLQKSELDRYLSTMGIPRPYVDLDLYTYLASIFQAHTATCLVSTVLLAWIQTVQTCYVHV